MLERQIRRYTVSQHWNARTARGVWGEGAPPGGGWGGWASPRGGLGGWASPKGGLGGWVPLEGGRAGGVWGEKTAISPPACGRSAAGTRPRACRGGPAR